MSLPLSRASRRLIRNRNNGRMWKHVNRRYIVRSLLGNLQRKKRSPLQINAGVPLLGMHKRNLAENTQDIRKTSQLERYTSAKQILDKVIDENDPNAANDQILNDIIVAGLRPFLTALVEKAVADSPSPDAKQGDIVQETLIEVAKQLVAVFGLRFMALAALTGAGQQGYYQTKPPGNTICNIPVPNIPPRTLWKSKNFGVLLPKVEEDVDQDNMGLGEKIGPLVMDLVATLGKNLQRFDYGDEPFVEDIEEYFPITLEIPNPIPFGDPIPVVIEVEQFRDLLFSEFFQVWPDQYKTLWQGMDTDEGTSAYSFFAISSHLMKKVTSPKQFESAMESIGVPDAVIKLSETPSYFLDITKLSKFDVRTPYVRYGAVGFYDSNQQITGIYVSHLNETILPGDGMWEHAKFVLRTTSMVHTTMLEHLGEVHIIVGNTVATACRENLGADHPMRRFLNPHYFNLASANINAPLLLGYFGFFHLASSMTYDGLYKSVSEYEKNFQFKTFPERLEENGMAGEDPMVWGPADSLELFDIIEEYVAGYLEVYYPNGASDLLADEEFISFYQELVINLGAPRSFDYDVYKKWLAQYILNASGLHEQFGKVMGIVGTDKQVGGRIRAEQSMQDCQGWLGVATLAVATTGIEPRLIDDYSRVFLDDENRRQVDENFWAFRARLRAYAKVVDERNATRVSKYWNYNSFNPAVIGCSVSI